jgi:hypothetical protein
MEVLFHVQNVNMKLTEISQVVETSSKNIPTKTLQKTAENRYWELAYHPRHLNATTIWHFCE